MSLALSLSLSLSPSLPAMNLFQTYLLSEQCTESRRQRVHNERDSTTSKMDSPT